MLNPNYPYPQTHQINHHPGAFPSAYTTNQHSAPFGQHRSYGQEELVWSGPLGFPFVQPTPPPYHHQFPNESSHVQAQVFIAPNPQAVFADMIQHSGIHPYPPQPHTHHPAVRSAQSDIRARISVAAPNSNVSIPRHPAAAPHNARQSPKPFRELIFDGCNFPFRFLGPSRRESYCSSMPQVAYCEANRDIKLPGSSVRLADPKDVVDLFDQLPNAHVPSNESTTWIFRGIHVRLCETFVDVKTGIAELMAFRPEILGLDCEWYHKKPGTLALIQISSARHCLLIRVCKIGARNYPQEFCDLLSNPKIVKVGAGVKDDAEKIEKILGVRVPSTIDLNWLVERAPMVSNGNFRRGLKKQALSFLHTKMVGEYGQFFEASYGLSKHTNIACTNWEVERLSMLQILYAADDAIFSYMVFMKLYLSFDRKRPCPNFDDSLYSVQLNAAEVLARLHDLIDRPAWMPIHLRYMNSEEPFFERDIDLDARAKHSQNDLTKKFGNILSAITACAPLDVDNMAQTALLTLMDVYDTPPKRKQTNLA